MQEDKEDKSKGEPADCRLFLRMIIRHVDIFTKEASFEFIQVCFITLLIQQQQFYYTIILLYENLIRLSE